MLGKAKRNLSPEEKRFFCLCAFTVVLLFTSILPQSTFARTWYIKADGTGDAPTIQAGVDSAAAGDTVLVGDGIYIDASERVIGGVPRIVNVFVSKNVALIADGSSDDTVIDGTNSDIALYANDVGSDCAIEGFGIHTRVSGWACIAAKERNSASVLTLGVGIWCDSSSAQIRGNVVSTNNVGILLKSSCASITENRVFACGTGIECDDNSDAQIMRNDMFDCGSLVSANYSSPIVSDNEMRSSQDIVCEAFSGLFSSAVISNNRISGIEVYAINCGGGSPVIEDNSIEDCNYGALRLGGTNTALVRRNLILIQPTAILVDGGSGVVIENNTIQQAGAGLYLDQTAVPTVANNIVEGCESGVVCLFPSDPVITCNDVYDCQQPYAGTCADRTGADGNFSQDPEYCGIDGSGNYFLQSDSPCAPGNHPSNDDCGLIGARKVNCGMVSIKNGTWGNLKSLYRR
jgi:parallel beta-helix repeat protein